MKAIDNIKSFKERAAAGELTIPEAFGIFIAMITVVGACLYVFAW